MRIWLLCVLACTQDFEVFAPKDATSMDAPMDAGSDNMIMMGVDSPAADTSSCSGATYNGHCYFLVASGTQTATRTACQNAGAHLVTFGSAAEQTATLAVGTPDWWIGLYRNGGPPKDGFYNWITGEPRTYTNWAPNEPDGTGQCVLMQSNATWADEDCTQTKQGLCERP